MEYYYTDTIFISKDSMYKIENGKNKKITKSNWHLYLHELGWCKLPRKWIIQINQLTEGKDKNSRYGVYNVQSDGDCFFHCIAYAINEKLGYYEHNSTDIRKMISEGIDNDMYNCSLRYYKIMKDANDFHENWDPYKIKNIDEYKGIISSSGHQHWLDYILLSHITNILNINIIILDNYNIYNTLIEYDKNKSSIILLYENRIHFNLIGYFDKYMKTYFEELPVEIAKLKKL